MKALLFMTFFLHTAFVLADTPENISPVFISTDTSTDLSEENSFNQDSLIERIETAQKQQMIKFLTRKNLKNSNDEQTI